MKKLLLEVLAWLVLAGIIGGLTWLGMGAWAWEIEHCFGM